MKESVLDTFVLKEKKVFSLRKKHMSKGDVVSM